MAKQIPDNWNSLNVGNDLGLRGDYPRNLAVYKVKGTEKLGCRWLPAEDEDTRPNHGRNKSGKRKYIFGRTGSEDPFQAGKQAISWCKDQKKKLQLAGEVEKYNSNHSLHHYWDIWWQKLNDRSDKTARTKRDTLNKWNGQGWGIAEQKWSKKSVEEINALDMEEYFSLLDKRGSGKKGSMAKQKEAQKTLLNHLIKEARQDFPQLQNLIYPTIKKQVEEVEHFTAKEWQELMNKAIDLSGGVAKKTISKKEYEQLEWSNRSRFNQRNWVDFYDCLLLQWFFYLRPRDMPRLRSEWFIDLSNENVRLYLEDTKQGRPKHETFPYRPDAYKFWKRMVRRRPKGYLAFPFYKRKEGEENESNVGATLNYLLQHAVELCQITKREKPVWGIIRHTAFRLTLEEMPELGIPPSIDTFASNGHTSADMLRKNYLYHIEREQTAKEARKKIKPSDYSLIKRVSLND